MAVRRLLVLGLTTMSYPTTYRRKARAAGRRGSQPRGRGPVDEPEVTAARARRAAPELPAPWYSPDRVPSRIPKSARRPETAYDRFKRSVGRHPAVRLARAAETAMSLYRWRQAQEGQLPHHVDNGWLIDTPDCGGGPEGPYSWGHTTSCTRTATYTQHANAKNKFRRFAVAGGYRCELTYWSALTPHPIDPDYAILLDRRTYYKIMPDTSSPAPFPYWDDTFVPGLLPIIRPVEIPKTPYWLDPDEMPIGQPLPVPEAPPHRLIPDRVSHPDRVYKTVRGYAAPAREAALDDLRGPTYEIAPDGSVKTDTSPKPHIQSPPKTGTKERKARIMIAGRAAKLIGQATEGMDLLVSIYEGLPQKIRDKVERENKGFVTVQDRMAAIYTYLDQLDLAVVAENILANMIEDKVIGTVGSGAAKGTRNMAEAGYWDRPFGWALGPAL